MKDFPMSAPITSSTTTPHRNTPRFDCFLVLSLGMIAAAGFYAYPVTLLCLIGAIVGCVFFLARLANDVFSAPATKQPLFTLSKRTGVFAWLFISLCTLLMLAPPLAIIFLLPLCGGYARRRRAMADLPSDFIAAMRDVLYRRIIIVMLVLLAGAALYGFKVTPQLMNQQAITLESFTRLSAR